MRLLPTDEQGLLRESARSFLEAEYPLTRVRELLARPESERRDFHEAYWKQIAELGWLGLLWSEQSGGLGLGHVEQSIILEELGRALVPSPYLSTILAGSLVERLGEEDQRRETLGAIAAGELSVALAMSEEGGEDPSQWTCRAHTKGNEIRVTGTKLYVADARVVSRLLVAAKTGDAETSWLWVDGQAQGVEVTALETMDATRPLYRIDFAGAPARRLGAPGAFGRAWGEVEPLYWASLAAEALGGSERVLRDAVAYAKERVQFGVPIGAQQAIKHKCANLLIRVEATRAIVGMAARSLDQGGPEVARSCAMAKAYATEAYREVAGEGIQIHGGVGFTWEFDCHLFYKRARANEITGGHPDEHRERIATEEGL